MRHFWWLLVPACAALAAPAEARPRDDALSGAFRCASVADSRQWLDCYYGAAQPVRDEVMASAAGCNRVAGDRPWLDCYYAAAAPMRVQLGLSAPAGATSRPAPQMAPQPAPQTAYVPPPRPAAPSGPPPMPRSTGLFNGMFNDIKPVVRNVPMQSYSLDKKGAFTVTLADGEVWTQQAEDEVHHPAHWREAGPNTLVTISPDALHTFTMVVSGEERFYKVKRIH